MQLAFEVAGQIIHTLWRTIPWLVGMGIAFAVLSRLAPCNDTKPWWKKDGLVTDFGYWIFIPIFTRYLRIWVTVFITIWLFSISDGDKIAEFYADGHGWIAQQPLWLQVIGYLVITDFVLYWIHRGFHRGGLWKYHAIHHASKDLEWTSAARFHPVNQALGPAVVDVAMLLAGFSPNIFLFVGPFDIITSCMVHANLNWTFGPFRYLFVSPVFHRWHHSTTVHDKNLASTFAIWDVMFGTAYMPAKQLPQAYGIDDPDMPEGLWPQVAYPLVQRAPQTAEPKPA